MADEGNADTFEYELNGRVMILRKTSSAQLMMLQRMVRQLNERIGKAASDETRLSELMTQLNDMVFEAAESRFIDPSDLTFVQTEILRGKLEQEDIYPILFNGHKPAASLDDDADPAPAKKPRKAPAKKVPSRPAQRRGAR